MAACCAPPSSCAGRLCVDDHEPVPVALLSGDRLAERDVPAVLESVRAEAEELHRAAGRKKDPLPPTLRRLRMGP